MKRRDFVVSLAAQPISRALGQGSRPLRPATLDIRDPVKLAAECIINRMDPDQEYRPWFAVDVVDSKPVALRHEIWDFGDTSARFLEGLILARQMFPATTDMIQAESRMRRYFLSLFGDSGVVWNPEKKQPDHMFSQGSALYALVTDYEANGSPTIRSRIERMIDGLTSMATQESDYLWFPQVATKLGPCSHQAAYQVLPVVRFYELTSHAPALKYAERLSRWPLYYDPTITPEGVITKPGWEGHLHAWMDTFSGILRCSRVSSELDRKAIVARSRKLYEWVRATHTSPFGWVADSVGSKTCETDTITSAMRLALELVREGYTEYWNDVERYLRNQLVENQFRDVGRLNIADPATSRGLKGCFESYADPNTLVAMKKGTIEGCCINGGIRGFYLAYQNAIEESAGEIRINLLISTGSSGIEVSSYLPFEGRLDLYPAGNRPISLRCPDWVRPDRVKVTPANVKVEPEAGGNYVRISGFKASEDLSVYFDQPEQEKEHKVAGKTYRAKWRGDTVLEMLPPGEPYPIYLRKALRPTLAPMHQVDIAYLPPGVHW
jgi:hypothetical protein